MISQILLSYQKEKAQLWIKSNDKNSSQNTYIFDDDGYNVIIHARGIIDLSNKSFDKIPFQFGSIDGSFFINNCNLLTLINSPFEVKGNFSATHNQFSSLAGCPEYVGEDFNIQFCDNLQSFLAGPQQVIGNYLSSGTKYLRFLHTLHTKFGRFSHTVDDRKEKLVEVESLYQSFNDELLFQTNFENFQNIIKKISILK